MRGVEVARERGGREAADALELRGPDAGEHSSDASAAGPGNAMTSSPISIRVPSSAASASLTRRACAIETRWERTAQTAASNGVPKQTGRRPSAAANRSREHRVAVGERGQAASVDVQRQHPRRVGLDTRRGQIGDEVDVDRLARPDRAERDRLSPVVRQRDGQRLGRENGPRGRSEIVTGGA